MNSPVQPVYQLSELEIRSLVEAAAQAGAKKALADLGLHDDGAGEDVRELRNLLDSWREAKKAAFSTAIKVLTTGFLTAVAGVLYFKGVK